MAELYRYAAFISYSSKDGGFARRLHRALERYSVPRSLGRFDLLGGGGKYNRIYPVFRDREELPAGELGPQIEASLKASNALIVVCSPNAAASPWVQKEIEFFVALGRRERMFAIIADKAPLLMDGADATTACFPPAFRSSDLEPIAADTRSGRDGFRGACLKVVAALVGVNPGKLADRDKRRRTVRRLQIVAASIVTFVAAVFGGGSMLSENLRQRSASLAELAERAITEGRYDRAARYARLGIVMADWPLVGYPAPQAEAQLRRIVASWDVPLRLTGHRDEVTAGAFSLDGALAATGGRDGELRIWSMTQGELLAELPGEGERSTVEKLEFSSDGARLLVVRERGTAEIRLIQTPQEAIPLVGGLSILRAAFDSSGALIATAGTQTLAVWNAETGQLIRRFAPSLDSVTDVAFNSQNDRIITSRVNTGAQVWNATTGALVFELPGDVGGRDAVSVGFSPDGGMIETTFRDGGVRLWRTDNGQPISDYRGHAAGELVTNAVFSPDGDRIASYSPWENAVRLWDIGSVGFHRFTGEDRVLRLPEAYEAIAVDFHGQGLRVLVTRRLSTKENLMQALDSGITHDRTVYVWESWVAHATRASMADLHDVRDAEYDARGERIVAGGSEGVAILSAQTGAPLRRLPAPEDIVSDVAFSADGGRIVAAFHSGVVRIWDAASGTERAALNGHRGAAYSAAFSHDGGRVVTTGDDGMVRVWDVQTGRGIAELPQDAVSASFDATGRRVLIRHSSAIRIWTPGSGAPPIDLAIPEGQIWHAEWDRGRPRVMVALSTGSALFDARSGALLGMGTARTPVDSLWGAAFDTTGVMLAVIDSNSIHILDVATGVELDVLSGDVDTRPRGTAFSPLGERLISWSDAGLHVWTLDPALTAPRANVMEYVCAAALAGWSILSEEELREAPMLSASDLDACALDRVM